MDLTIDPVRLPPRRDGPSVSSVLAGIAIVLVVAIVKPWGTPAEGGPPIRPARPVPTEQPIRTPAPTPDTARQLVAALCLEPNGWRLYATERWSDRGVRSWKSIEPVPTADGPDDPRIPMFLEASRTVLTLGYCAPVTGPDRPPSPTTTTIYRLAEAGAAPGDDRSWDIIEPARAEPVTGSSALGGAWAPPRTAAAGASPAVQPRGWPSGTYVFQIRGGAGSDPYERWFGVVVEVTRSAIP